MNAIWKLAIVALLLVGTIAASGPIAPEEPTAPAVEMMTVPKAEVEALLTLVFEQDAALRKGSAVLREAFTVNRKLLKDIDKLEKDLDDAHVKSGCV